MQNPSREPSDVGRRRKDKEESKKRARSDGHVVLACHGRHGPNVSSTSFARHVSERFHRGHRSRTLCTVSILSWEFRGKGVEVDHAVSCMWTGREMQRLHTVCI